MAYTIEKGKKFIPADSACFQYVGRIDDENPARPVMIWPGSYADVEFTGTSAAVVLKNINFQEDTHFAVIVDGVMKKITLPTDRQDNLYSAAEGLEDKRHTLRILKTMAAHNYLEFAGIVVDEGAEVSDPAHKYDMKLEVYGDSVSAGEVTEAIYYEGQCDPEDHRNRLDNSHFSYALNLGRKLNAEVHDIAQGGIALLDGTGYFCSDQLTGMESCWDKLEYTPYAERKPWDFSRWTADAVIIAIGQNDANPEPERIKKPEYRRMWKDHYIAFLRTLMGKYPAAKFVLILTVLGHDPTWDDALEEIAQEVDSDRVSHFMFRRTGKGTNGHPRATEQEEMAGELYNYFKGTLGF